MGSTSNVVAGVAIGRLGPDAPGSAPMVDINEEETVDYEGSAGEEAILSLLGDDDL